MTSTGQRAWDSKLIKEVDAGGAVSSLRVPQDKPAWIQLWRKLWVNCDLRLFSWIFVTNAWYGIFKRFHFELKCLKEPHWIKFVWLNPPRWQFRCLAPERISQIKLFGALRLGRSNDWEKSEIFDTGHMGTYCPYSDTSEEKSLGSINLKRKKCQAQYQFQLKLSLKLSLVFCPLFCQAQPKLSLIHLSWAEIALFSQLWGTYPLRHTPYTIHHTSYNMRHTPYAIRHTPFTHPE